MDQFRIFYEQDFNKWIDTIEKALNKEGIIYDKELPTTICRSLNETIKAYLRKLNHKPKDTLSWRKNLISRLRSQGVDLSIVSNRVLWLYLEHFTDITDFSKAFDIKVTIKDWKSAASKIEVVSIRSDKDKNPIKVAIRLDSTEELYHNLQNKLIKIQQYSSTYGFINDLVDTLSYLAERSKLNEKE